MIIGLIIECAALAASCLLFARTSQRNANNRCYLWMRRRPWKVTGPEFTANLLLTFLVFLSGERIALDSHLWVPIIPLVPFVVAGGLMMAAHNRAVPD